MFLVFCALIGFAGPSFSTLQANMTAKNDLGSALAPHDKGKISNSSTNLLPICQYATGAVLAITFASNADCSSFADSATVGAAEGYAYSNCSVSTYCITFETAGAADLQGRNVVAISGTGVAGTKLTFPSALSCSAAVNATATSGGNPSCQGDVLFLPIAGNGEATKFAMSIENLNITGISSQNY